jgi:hypothetical protein
MFFTFLFGLFAHLAADCNWQGKTQSEWKAFSNFILAEHAAFVSLAVAITMWFITGASEMQFIEASIYLFLIHFAIDFWKSRLVPRDSNHFWAVIMDQSLHILSVAMIAWKFTSGI